MSVDTAPEPVTEPTVSAMAEPRRGRRGSGNWSVFVLLGVVLAWIWWLDHDFVEPPSLMAYVKKAAPLIVLAIGQYFVMIAGELDLSVGSLVGAQVVIAAKLLDGEDGRTWWVLAVMIGFGLLVGLINGLVVTILRVPSFIATLGMMLVLFGAVRLWTGGAPTGELSERFRNFGRGGIDIELVRQLPWSVLIAVAIGVVAVAIMRSSFGRTLIAIGDSPRAARFSAVRVERARVIAFVLSSLIATIAGVLIGGFGGLTAQVGQGLEFTAITAVVLGGVALSGGRGLVLGAMAGALTLEAIFRLFRQFDWASSWEPTVQGVIIIAAVAYSGWRPDLRLPTRRPRPPSTTQASSPGGS